MVHYRSIDHVTIGKHRDSAELVFRGACDPQDKAFWKPWAIRCPMLEQRFIQPLLAMAQRSRSHIDVFEQLASGGTARISALSPLSVPCQAPWYAHMLKRPPPELSRIDDSRPSAALSILLSKLQSPVAQAVGHHSS